MLLSSPVVVVVVVVVEWRIEAHGCGRGVVNERYAATSCGIDKRSLVFFIIYAQMNQQAAHGYVVG